MRTQKLLTIAGLTVGMLITPLNAQSLVNVTMTLTVDNNYAIYATDPVTGALTLIGSEIGPANNEPYPWLWMSAETYSFSAPFGSYLYIVGRDWHVVAMFAALTTLSGAFGSVTVQTGVANPATNWEVNELYRDTSVDLTDPNQVLNWGSSSWVSPAVGRDVRPDDGLFGNQLLGAYYIWALPGGGNHLPPQNRWGFSDYTGAGTALFRLHLVPEPASLLALGAGLAGLVGLRRRRK